jgi:cardiolipin synthase A/B
MAKPTGGKHRHSFLLKLMATIGVLATGGVALDVFLGYGRGPLMMRPTESLAAGSPEFLRAVAGVLGAPLRSGGTGTVLLNGKEFYPALLADIRAAQRTVDITVYIWEPGSPSDEIVAALQERARRGVQVRILLDGLGGRNLGKETRAALRAAGVKVEEFRPARFGQLTRFHKRNHRRAMVVDGKVAFTGGMAVAPQWLGDADSEDHWRDTMFRFTGPPASMVQSAFADIWAYSTGELLAGDDFFPEFPTPLPSDSDSVASAAPDPFLHTGLTSAPSKEDHPLGLLLLLTVSGARHRIQISTPYFIPDRTMRAALIERARAGVDVRVLLPGRHIDHNVVRLAAQYRYQELLAAGVHIFEYEPTMMHSKSIVVDGVWAVVGSPNLNVRSRNLDHENAVCVSNRAFAGRLEEVFARDLQRSREVTYVEWAKRSLWARLKERVSYAISQVS